MSISQENCSIENLRKMFRNEGAKFFVILFLVGSLTACAGTNRNQVSTGLGALLGAGAGAFIGEAVGGEDGALIGAAVGALGGGLAGHTIANYLDERDRQIAAAATKQALDTPVDSGQTPAVTWNSDHNKDVGGKTTVTAVDYNTRGQECRQTHEVAYVQGKEVSENGMHCRDPNGGPWKRVS